MKLALLLSVLLSADATGSAASASGDSRVLTLEEVDEDSITVEITSDTAVVDIGSTIHVGVSRERAMAKLGTVATGASERTATLVKNAQSLADALQRANQATDDLGLAMRLWTTNPPPETIKRIQDASGKAATHVSAIVEQATPGSRFGKTLEAALDDVSSGGISNGGISDTELFRRITEAAAVEVVALQTDLRLVLQEEGAYFMLGAWVVGKGGTRALHLDGFDDIKPPDRFVLDRRSIVLTQEQQEVFAKAASIAHQFNTEGAGALVRSKGLPLLLDSFKRTTQSLGGTATSAKEVATTVEGLSNTLKEELTQTTTEMLEYLTYLERLIRKYQAATPTADSEAELLALLNADVREAVLRAQSLAKKIKQLQSNLSASPAALTPPVQKLNDALRLTAAALVADIDRLAEGVTSLFSLARVNAELLEFSQQVRRHSVDSLPSETVLDLNNTGRREPGDAVVFRFAMGRGEQKPTVVETRQLTMHRILPYFDTTVGLIFARVPDDEEGPSRFQAAPAYSVLLKWGDRDETYVNSIVTPGVGINLSALDFNRDNTPEVGVALTLSLFRNIVQAGGGYNVFRDNWYFFFGVGLPLPTIGGLPTNASSSLPDP